MHYIRSFVRFILIRENGPQNECRNKKNKTYTPAYKNDKLFLNLNNKVDLKRNKLEYRRREKY